MSILTYKQYKLLNENLDSVIGVSTPKNIGLQTEAPQLYNMMSKMAKKMAGGPGGAKKPPMGGDMDMDMGPDADVGGGAPDMDPDALGDEEMGDDDLDPDAEGLGDDDDAEGDEDMDDEEGLGDDEMGDMGMGGMDMGMGMGPMGAGSPPPGMGGPMGGGPDMGMGLGGPPMKGKGKKAPPMMMKKMHMGGMKYMKKEAADPQDAKMKGQNRKNGANDQNDCGPGPASKKTTTVRENKCCDKCGNMMGKKCNKMTKEQREFNDSLMRQAGSLKFQQDELGYWVPVKNEDVLVQSKVTQRAEEPQPGEVGFAPQGKVGNILGSSFTEWASRHVDAVKKNKR